MPKMRTKGKGKLISVEARPGKFYTAKLPKGSRSLTPELQRAIDNMTQKLSPRGDCTLIFFKKPRGRGRVAVQRCERSKKFKSSAFRAAARRRMGKLCRNPSTGRIGRCRKGWKKAVRARRK